MFDPHVMRFRMAAAATRVGEHSRLQFDGEYASFSKASSSVRLQARIPSIRATLRTAYGGGADQELRDSCDGCAFPLSVSNGGLFA